MNQLRTPLSSSADTAARRLLAGRSVSGIVMGASAGGITAVARILESLPCKFPVPVLVVQHRHAADRFDLSVLWGPRCQLVLREPLDKEPIRPGFAYIGPANYHMLVEKEGCISLSVDQKVNWSRPSIDVLFDSAARAWGAGLLAILLTGSNSDGTAGMRSVRLMGGLNVVQDPDEAEASTMPKSAIDAGVVDAVLPLADIASFLTRAVGEGAS